MAASRPGTADKAVQDGDHWVIKGNLFGRPSGQQIETFGLTNAEIGKFAVGATAPMADGGQLTVEANGDYVWTFDQQPTFKGAPRIYYVTGSPPRFTLENYARVLGSTGVATTALEKAIRATGAPLEVLEIADQRPREVYGYDLLLVRPDLHVVWRGNRPPPEVLQLAAIATGWDPAGATPGCF